MTLDILSAVNLHQMGHLLWNPANTRLPYVVRREAESSLDFLLINVSTRLYQNLYTCKYTAGDIFGGTCCSLHDNNFWCGCGDAKMQIYSSWPCSQLKCFRFRACAYHKGMNQARDSKADIEHTPKYTTVCH